MKDLFWGLSYPNGSKIGIKIGINALYGKPV
jgi:hypothetical protein